MRKAWFLVSVLLAFGLVGFAGYLGFRNTQPDADPTSQAPNTIPVTVCDVTQSVTAPGMLVNKREVTLEMPMTAQLAEVLVRPGDFVQFGQVLARLDSQAELTAQASAAKMELLQAEGDLQALTTDIPILIAQAHRDVLDFQLVLEEAQRYRDRLELPRANSYQLEQAETYFKAAEARLKKAQKAFDRVTALPVSHPKRIIALDALLNAKANWEQRLSSLNWYLGGPSEQEIASADAQIALAQAQFEVASNKWERLQDGGEPPELELAKKRVDNAEASLAAALNDLAAVEIKAPFSGIILEVHAHPGSTLTAYTPLFVLNDPSAVEVEATVIEEDYPYVKIGQPVILFFDAHPDAEVSGKITRILPMRASGERPLYYIYVSLETLPANLVAGMNVDASVVIQQRKSVLCLPRTVVGTSSQGQANVEMWSGERVEERLVETGLRGDVNVEVVSGLVEGEQVIIR